jgi:hypothetical protein
VSSAATGNQIQATDDKKFCYANASNECRTGSSPGTIYVAIAGLTSASNIWTNQYDSLIPAIVPAAPIGDKALQWDVTQSDPSGMHWRWLTKGFGSASRLFNTWNWRPLPDAAWGWIPSSYPSGQFGMTFLAKLPPWPAYDAVVRNSYVNVPITVPAGSAFAEIRFGYETNGSTSQFYCQTRAEACITKATPTATNPFNFLSDGHSGIACTSGCTVQIPGISGQLVWYQIFTSPDNVTYTGVGAPANIAVP